MFPLYLDEDSLTRALVRGLRIQGIDVVTAAEAGNLGVRDEQQLAFAATQDRSLYTANVADFARLHDRWMREGRHHAGVILVRQEGMSLTGRLDALAHLMNTHSQETMQDRLEFLSNWAMGA